MFIWSPLKNSVEFRTRVFEWAIGSFEGLTGLGQLGEFVGVGNNYIVVSAVVAIGTIVEELKDYTYK